jgi:hypothetical protein
MTALLFHDDTAPVRACALQQQSSSYGHREGPEFDLSQALAPQQPQIAVLHKLSTTGSGKPAGGASG